MRIFGGVDLLQDRFHDLVAENCGSAAVAGNFAGAGQADRCEDDGAGNAEAGIDAADFGKGIGDCVRCRFLQHSAGHAGEIAKFAGSDRHPG